MTDIAFETLDHAVAGRAEQVSPLVRRIVCGNPGPFTYRGTNTYVVGSGEVAVIDPGPDDAAHLAAILAAVAGERVARIVVTHTHKDHSPLAARLKEITGAPTVGHGPHGAGRSSAGIGGGSVLDASGDMAFRPDVEIADGDTIEGEGWTLEAVFTPGHTANHMAFALKEETALFSGDHVMAWSTSVIAPPDGNMADYLSSLETLIERRDDRTYWPGHGPHKHDPLPFVRAFLTHRRMREEAIFKRIAAGDREVMQIVRAVYAGLDERLHGAAALSTLAHLEHLIEQGRISSDGPLGHRARYEVKR